MLIRRLLVKYPGGISLGLVVIVFLVDLSLPLGVASAVPYTFAVLLALSAKPRWFGPTLAGVCCVLTLLKMELVPDRGSTEMWKVVTNRCLALFAIGMTTYLGILRRRAARDREQAEEQARQHQAELTHMGRLTMLGQLAAGLAHELNQPLAAIGLQAELAMRYNNASQTDVSMALNEIAEQSTRAGEIIRSIRRMSRFDKPGHDPVDLNEAVHSVLRLLDWNIQQRRATVQLSLSQQPIRTLGDRIQIEQVLLNLIQNAIDAIGERSDGSRTITVETGIQGEQAIVTIADTGKGIAEPERVFDRFYTTKPNGMGLGLAISKSIVEAHAGTLRASSTANGATFTVALPLIVKESR